MYVLYVCNQFGHTGTACAQVNPIKASTTAHHWALIEIQRTRPGARPPNVLLPFNVRDIQL